MDFNKYAIKGNIIIDELAEELGFPGDRKLSGRILRAVLHTIRGQISMSDSFQLMAQLPMALKSVYVTGWKPSVKPVKATSLGEFIRWVIKKDFPVGHHDIGTVKDGTNAIIAVFRVLIRHLSEGEAKRVVEILPKELRSVFEGERNTVQYL